MWATPAIADMSESVRLLLKNPHLVLKQSVAPSARKRSRALRARMTDYMRGPADDVAAAVGAPVSVSTCLQATTAPWTLPLRFREHLRGWFDYIDLDETIGEPQHHIVPELQATGLLRFPVTHDFVPGHSRRARGDPLPDPGRRLIGSPRRPRTRHSGQRSGRPPRRTRRCHDTCTSSAKRAVENRPC